MPLRERDDEAPVPLDKVSRPRRQVVRDTVADGPLAAPKAGSGETKCEFTQYGVALELCCGVAKLTQCLRQRGLDAIGIDWVRNKARPCGQ